jgi:hypothetical protein
VPWQPVGASAPAGTAVASAAPASGASGAKN